MTNRNYKHADKIIRKWKGGWSKDRANRAIDAVTEGMKETMPKYKKFYRPDGSYYIINLHDMLA